MLCSFCPQSLDLPQSSCFNCIKYYRLFFWILYIELLLLNRNDEVTGGTCGTQTPKLNLARHKKICSVGVLTCSKCPQFSTKACIDTNYHIDKKTPQNLSLPSRLKLVIKIFQDFTPYGNKKRPRRFFYQHVKCWASWYHLRSGWHET